MNLQEVLTSFKQVIGLGFFFIGCGGLIIFILYCSLQPYLRKKGIITDNKKRTSIGNRFAIATLVVLILGGLYTLM